MNSYMFASSHDGDKFEAFGKTIDEAFESLDFNAEAYQSGEYEADDLTGKPIDVWGWDEDGERHDWTAYFK